MCVGGRGDVMLKFFGGVPQWLSFGLFGWKGIEAVLRIEQRKIFAFCGIGFTFGPRFWLLFLPFLKKFLSSLSTLIGKLL